VARQASSAGASGKSSEARARIPVTEAALSEALLSYLDRFEASHKRLGQYLQKWVRARGEPANPEDTRRLIERVLARYETAGLLDDSKLAERSLERLRRRGGSARAIAFKLHTKGVAADATERAFERERSASANAELEAARALVRRRKLGEFRPEAERAEKRRRDLGVLARAGFAYDIAVTALGGRRDDEF
jgi:regulatory protein